MPSSRDFFITSRIWCTSPFKMSSDTNGEFNMISTVAAFALGLSQLLFAWNIWRCVKGGEKATDKVWEGAEGLEWQLSSPPPYHSWETQPVVK